MRAGKKDKSLISPVNKTSPDVTKSNTNLDLTKSMLLKVTKSKPKSKEYKKINVADALKLRIVNHLSYQEIADKYGVTKQAVFDALTRFQRFIDNPETIKAYREHKTDLLDVVEMTMLEDMLDQEKRKKATLGNTAYALTQVFNANRLEKGQSTSNIAYQDISAKLQELEAEEEKLMKEIAALEMQTNVSNDSNLSNKINIVSPDLVSADNESSHES